MLALTRAVARGDPRAFDRLYDLYRHRLDRYLLVLARGDQELAGDAFQETMIRVVRYLRPLPREEVLWGWLVRTARTALIDLVRRGQRHQRVQRLPEGAGLDVRREESSSRARLLEILEEVLGQLDPEERALVEEHHQQGRRLADLARERGTTAKAVESRLARIRRRLRESMMETLRRE